MSSFSDKHSNRVTFSFDEDISDESHHKINSPNGKKLKIPKSLLKNTSPGTNHISRCTFRYPHKLVYGVYPQELDIIIEEAKIKKISWRKLSYTIQMIDSCLNLLYNSKHLDFSNRIMSIFTTQDIDYAIVHRDDDAREFYTKKQTFIRSVISAVFCQIKFHKDELLNNKSKDSSDNVNNYSTHKLGKTCQYELDTVPHLSTTETPTSDFDLDRMIFTHCLCQTSDDFSIHLDSDPNAHNPNSHTPDAPTALPNTRSEVHTDSSFFGLYLHGMGNFSVVFNQYPSCVCLCPLQTLSSFLHTLDLADVHQVLDLSPLTSDASNNPTLTESAKNNPLANDPSRISKLVDALSLLNLKTPSGTDLDNDLGGVPVVRTCRDICVVIESISLLEAFSIIAEIYNSRTTHTTHPPLNLSPHLSAFLPQTPHNPSNPESEESEERDSGCVTNIVKCHHIYKYCAILRRKNNLRLESLVNSTGYLSYLTIGSLLATRTNTNSNSSSNSMYGLVLGLNKLFLSCLFEYVDSVHTNPKSSPLNAQTNRHNAASLVKLVYTLSASPHSNSRLFSLKLAAVLILTVKNVQKFTNQFFFDLSIFDYVNIYVFEDILIGLLGDHDRSIRTLAYWTVLTYFSLIYDEDEVGHPVTSTSFHDMKMRFGTNFDVNVDGVGVDISCAGGDLQVGHLKSESKRHQRRLRLEMVITKYNDTDSLPPSLSTPTLTSTLTSTLPSSTGERKENQTHEYPTSGFSQYNGLKYRSNKLGDTTHPDPPQANHLKADKPDSENKSSVNSEHICESKTCYDSLGYICYAGCLGGLPYINQDVVDKMVFLSGRKRISPSLVQLLNYSNEILSLQKFRKIDKKLFFSKKLKELWSDCGLVNISIECSVNHCGSEGSSMGVLCLCIQNFLFRQKCINSHIYMYNVHRYIENLKLEAQERMKKGLDLSDYIPTENVEMAILRSFEDGELRYYHRPVPSDTDPTVGVGVKGKFLYVYRSEVAALKQKPLNTSSRDVGSNHAKVTVRPLPQPTRAPAPTPVSTPKTSPLPPPLTSAPARNLILTPTKLRIPTVIPLPTPSTTPTSTPSSLLTKPDSSKPDPSLVSPTRTTSLSAMLSPAPPSLSNASPYFKSTSSFPTPSPILPEHSSKPLTVDTGLFRREPNTDALNRVRLTRHPDLEPFSAPLDIIDHLFSVTPDSVFRATSSAFRDTPASLLFSHFLTLSSDNGSHSGDLLPVNSVTSMLNSLTYSLNVIEDEFLAGSGTSMGGGSGVGGDWENNLANIQMIRRLVHHHQSLLLPRSDSLALSNTPPASLGHLVVKLLIHYLTQEVASLRSSLSLHSTTALIELIHQTPYNYFIANFKPKPIKFSKNPNQSRQITNIQRNEQYHPLTLIFETLVPVLVKKSHEGDGVVSYLAKYCLVTLIQKIALGYTFYDSQHLDSPSSSPSPFINFASNTVIINPTPPAPFTEVRVTPCNVRTVSCIIRILVNTLTCRSDAGSGVTEKLDRKTKASLVMMLRESCYIMLMCGNTHNARVCNIDHSEMAMCQYKDTHGTPESCLYLYVTNTNANSDAHFEIDDKPVTVMNIKGIILLHTLSTHCSGECSELRSYAKSALFYLLQAVGIDLVLFTVIFMADVICEFNNVDIPSYLTSTLNYLNRTIDMVPSFLSHPHLRNEYIHYQKKYIGPGLPGTGFNLKELGNVIKMVEHGSFSLYQHITYGNVLDKASPTRTTTSIIHSTFASTFNSTVNPRPNRLQTTTDSRLNSPSHYQSPNRYNSPPTRPSFTTSRDTRLSSPLPMSRSPDRPLRTLHTRRVSKPTSKTPSSPPLSPPLTSPTLASPTLTSSTLSSPHAHKRVSRSPRLSFESPHRQPSTQPSSSYRPPSSQTSVPAIAAPTTSTPAPLRGRLPHSSKMSLPLPNITDTRSPSPRPLTAKKNHLPNTNTNTDIKTPLKTRYLSPPPNPYLPTNECQTSTELPAVPPRLSHSSESSLRSSRPSVRQSYQTSTTPSLDSTTSVFSRLTAQTVSSSAKKRPPQRQISPHPKDSFRNSGSKPNFN